LSHRSAAVVIAAARAGLVPVDAETALVISGRNIDDERLDGWLTG
jgi:hypothetical protein